MKVNLSKSQLEMIRRDNPGLYQDIICANKTTPIEGKRREATPELQRRYLLRFFSKRRAINACNSVLRGAKKAETIRFWTATKSLIESV